MIFLDLHKAYDALDRSRCLEILEGYGVGPRAQRLLRTYWGKMKMVARAGGYYGDTFKGARGVTQGNPLSPTIFIFPQYVLCSRLAWVPTPYPSKISRHLDLSKAAYALYRFNKIMYRTSYLMSSSC